MAENKKRTWDQSQLRKYNITTDSIPRLQYDDPKVLELILQNVRITAFLNSSLGLNRKLRFSGVSCNF